MIKRSLTALFYLNLFAFSSFFYGCGGGAEDPGAVEKEASVKGTIGVSVLTLGNPFFSVIAENVRIEAAKHGYDVIVVDGDRDVPKHANQIDDFFFFFLSAIILNHCDRFFIGTAVN